MVSLCINDSDVRFQPTDIASIMILWKNQLTMSAFDKHSFLFSLSHPSCVSANIFLGLINAPAGHNLTAQFLWYIGRPAQARN